MIRATDGQSQEIYSRVGKVLSIQGKDSNLPNQLSPFLAFQCCVYQPVVHLALHVRFWISHDNQQGQNWLTGVCTGVCELDADDLVYIDSFRYRWLDHDFLPSQ